jgi:hypothetical protein
MAGSPSKFTSRCAARGTCNALALGALLLPAALPGQVPAEVTAGASFLAYERGGEQVFTGFTSSLGWGFGGAQARFQLDYWPSLRQSSSESSGWSATGEVAFPALRSTRLGPYLLMCVGVLRDAHVRSPGAPLSSSVFGFGLGLGVPVWRRIGADVQGLVRWEFSSLDALVRAGLSYRVRGEEGTARGATLEVLGLFPGPGAYKAVEPALSFRVGGGCVDCVSWFASAGVWHLASRGQINGTTWDTRAFPLTVGIAASVPVRAGTRIDGMLGLQSTLVPEGPDAGVALGPSVYMTLSQPVGPLRMGLSAGGSTTGWKYSRPQVHFLVGLAVTYAPKSAGPALGDGSR